MIGQHPSTFEPKAARAGTSPRVVQSSDDSCIGTVGNLVVCHWFRETKLQDILTLDQLVKTTAKQFPKGIGLIQVIDPKAAPPGGEARRLISELLAAGSGSIQCSAIVIIGESFRMAAGRAVASALALLARPKFKHVVQSDLKECLEWQRGLLSAAGSQTFDVLDAARAIEMMPRLSGR